MGTPIALRRRWLKVGSVTAIELQCCLKIASKRRQVFSGHSKPEVLSQSSTTRRNRRNSSSSSTDCSASALIIGASHVGVHQAALSSVESLRCIVVSGGGAHSKVASCSIINFEKDLPSFPSSPLSRRSIDADLAALIYTSGSTGVPKGVAVSHLNVVSAANSITEYLENVADDVIIDVLPLSFDYGLYQLLMSVKLGATLVLERSFAYPFRIIEKIQEEQVTGFPGCRPCLRFSCS